MEILNEAKPATQVVPIEITHRGTIYKGKAVPLKYSCHDNVCFELDITLNNENLGAIRCTTNGWEMDNITDPEFVDAIGTKIFLWYE